MKIVHNGGVVLALVAFAIANPVSAQEPKLVRDINSGATASAPTGLVDINGTLLFAATDPTNGTELWKSDGTLAGTVLVKDINPGGGGSSPASLTNVNGTLFFVATDSTNGQELWKSDGTSGGTVLVKDIVSGSSSSSPSLLTNVGGTLFFTAFDSANGTELWKSDGTAPGTVLVKDILAGASSSSPSTLLNVGGTLFFSAFEASTGRELWKSDGTTGGTVIVRDIEGGISSSSPATLTVVGSSLFFTAFQSATGTELWVSDGTSGGTALVKDIRSGSTSTSPTNLVSFGGALFFSANDGVLGAELWKSDGTSGGTAIFKDLNPGSGSSSPGWLTVTGSTLYLVATDSAAGAELWKSDGTSVGTTIVKDVNPGTGSSFPESLKNVNGMLFFAANDGTNGRELWRSDGTSAGTVLTRDINPGGDGVLSGVAFEPSGAGLFFPANEGALGRELWVFAYSLGIADVSVTEGNSGSANATFTVAMLPPQSGTTVTVNYATNDGTATAGSDYTLTSGSLSFAPGETSKTIAVPVAGDTTSEFNEAFGLTLSSPTGAVLARGRAQGIILDDDRTGATARTLSVWHQFFAVDTLETPYVGDFNGDGKTDIITFTRQNPLAVGDVYVSLSNGTSFGTNTKWHDFFAINTSEQVVIGDYDGDGKDDIGTWLSTTSKQVYVALSQGTGMGTATVWVSSIGSDPSDVLQATDVNGDGKADMVNFARKEGKVYVALSTGTGFLTPTVWHGFFAVSTYERPRAGDLDGDGKGDIATFATDSPSAFGDVYTSISTGSRFGLSDVSSKWHDWFAIDPNETIRIGDLNGDGRDDFFTILPASRGGNCYTVLSLGSSMGANVLWPEIVAPAATDLPFVGDVDGDGKADIIVFAQSEGKVYISVAR